jgi:hypothetical protein
VAKTRQRSAFVTLEQARAAKAALLKQFRKQGIAAAVGVTRIGDDYAVKVNLTEQPVKSLKLPARIDGVPIRVEVTGAVRART